MAQFLDLLAQKTLNNTLKAASEAFFLTQLQELYDYDAQLKKEGFALFKEGSKIENC